jgi:TolA-binding protein
MKIVSTTAKLLLTFLWILTYTQKHVYAQEEKAAAGDSMALENVSSEDLLRLKEDLESQKTKLETERLQLLDKGLKQSKEYLEKSTTSSAATALVLLQRAEYLNSVIDDNFQVAVDSVAAENAKRLAEWDKMKDAKKAELVAQKKSDKDIEEILGQLPSPQLLQDPEKNYSEVLKTYQQLIDNFPESQYVVDAMYNIGFVKETEGKQLKARGYSSGESENRWAIEGDKKQKESLKIYQDLAVRFPDSKYAAESYNRIGEYYFGKGGDADLQKAIKNYTKVLDYPNSERFQEAVYKLAWTHYRLGNYPQAIGYFTYLVDDVDSARYYNNDSKELDVEALVYIGISFNRWAEQIDIAQGTSEGGHRLIRSYIADAKLEKKRYAPEIIWQLAESYNLEQKDTLALNAYKAMLDAYPLFWRAPDAQYKVIQTYERLSRSVTDKVMAKTLLDSVLQNRYKLYNAYKPFSEWSKVVEDKEVVSKGNRMARDVLVENIYYYYGEAGATNDKGQWKLAMDFSREFIRYFPVDTNAYFFHYNLAVIQYRFFGLLDSAYEDYVKVATLYPQDLYRYDAAVHAYNIADSLYRKTPYQKPANSPLDSVIALTRGEEKLVDAINTYARLFPDSVSRFPVDSLTNTKPVMGTPGKRTPDLLAYAGQIYYNHNNFPRAGQYFNTIVTRYPNSDKAQLSEKYLMKGYLDRKDYRSSEIIAKKLLSHPNSNKEQKDEAVRTIFYSIFKHAEVYKANKQPAKAGREYQRAYEEGNQIGHAKRDELSVALFNSGVEYASSKELKKSIKSFETFADSFPALKDAPTALWNVQATYAEMKEMKSAAKTAERLSDSYPNYSENKGAVTAEIALYNSEYYFEQAAKQANANGDSVQGKALNYEAIRVSGKFVTRYAKSEYTPSMDFGIANLYFLVNEEEKAYQKYRQFAVTFPNDKRNVQALYDVGMNHMRKGRRNEAVLAFTDAKKKSDDLKGLRLDFNRYFSSEAVYELAKLKYEDFSKIELREPNVDQKEDQKLALVKELITLYEAITGYAQIRTYEATYYRGLIREEFGDALANKEFRQEKDISKQIKAQSEVYFGAAQAYRTSVEEYKNSYAFLNKAYDKLLADEKVLADSVNHLYPKNADSAQMIIKGIVGGKTAKEKEFSLERQKELAIQYRDMSRAKVSRILYAVANARKLILDTYINAPTTFKYGTLEYISEKQQALKVIQGAATEAVKAFETAVKEMDSLGINDKYTSESRRNIVRFTGIVPSELGKLAFVTMDLYKLNSDSFRAVLSKGDTWVDRKTGKDFYTVAAEIPLEMNTYIQQFAKPLGEQAVKVYSKAITQAKEKKLFDEDARQIQREMFDFAYEFAKRNYQEADTADKYYKSYEAIFFKDKDNFAYYSDASSAYNQVLGFARENARGVLEEAYNSATDLEIVKLVPDPTGAKGDQLALTDNPSAKRILALLGKYDQYYAKLLKLKSSTKTYASNYDNWLSTNRFSDSWQTPGFDDHKWYNAAPPTDITIVSHAVLDTNKAYPLWLGLGQNFTVPELPKYVPPSEIVPVDTGKTAVMDTTAKKSMSDTTAKKSMSDTTKSKAKGAAKKDSVKSYVSPEWVLRGITLQDSALMRPVFTADAIKKQLDTAHIVYFRSTFDVTGSPQGGKMFVASDGSYDFYLNGAFIGSSLLEKEDPKGDSLEVQDLFPENFIQGKNVFAVVLKDMQSPKEHHGIRIFLEVNEVEDATAAFAEPAIPAAEQLKNFLLHRSRVTKNK